MRRSIPGWMGVCVWAGLLFGNAAFAAVSAEDPLPKADEILAKHIEALGGKEAFDKIQTRVAQATLDMSAQGIKLQMTIWSARPNKSYSLIESDVTGRIEQGCDGATVWSKSVMTGPRISKGKERFAALRDGAFERIVYWRDFYEKAECTGEEEVDGKPCVKIVLTPKPLDPEDVAHPLTLWVDKESFLLAKMMSTAETPMGTVPTTMLPGDWREVDGILIPHEMRLQVLNQERKIVTDKVEHNVDLPADRFDLPADVKALLDEEAKDADGG